jgi:hydroxylamine reductase (hybrid-cluster protein)
VINYDMTKIDQYTPVKITEGTSTWLKVYADKKEKKANKVIREAITAYRRSKEEKQKAASSAA